MESAEPHARGSCYLLELLIALSAAPHSSASERRGLSTAVSLVGVAVLAFPVVPVSPINFYSNNSGQRAINHMKIQPAVSERGSEPVAGSLVGCWHSVAFSMVQLHRYVQTPVVGAKLGVSRSEFGRVCPSPSVSRTGRPSVCCVKPAQPNLGVSLSVTLGS